MTIENQSLATLATNPEVGTTPTETTQTSEAETNEVETESTESTQDESGQDESDEGTESNSEKKPKKGFEKRIAKEISRRTQAQQEAEYWKKVALERGGNTQPAAAGTQEVPKPKFSDYNDIEAYTEAVTDWKMEQKLAAKLQENQQQNTARSIEQSYNQRVQEFQKVKPDFQEVLAGSDLQISKPVTELIFESDIGPAIVYYLAENEEETERINKLSPARQLAEIGKIEAKLATPAPKAKKSVSNAPAPVKPVSGGAPVTAKSLDDPTLSTDEWIKLRNKTKGFR